VIDEYRKLFDIMEAPPANAQNSDTPFKDVCRPGNRYCTSQGLDATNAEAAAVSAWALLCGDKWQAKRRESRSNTYKEVCKQVHLKIEVVKKKWAAIKESIRAFDPALSARDEMEERQGSAI